MSVESPSENQTLPKPKSKERAATSVKVGAVSVPIYPMGDGRWCIVYRPTPKAARQRVLRSDLAAAKEKAREICVDILNGQTSAAALTPNQRLEAVSAQTALEPLGISLDAAARELAEAHRISGGAGILEMARFWARHHGALLSRKTAAELHAEMLSSKQHLGLSKVYDQQLRNDLAHFARAFEGTALAEIEPDQIEKYLRDREVGWVRFNKLRSLIITLFLFAKSRKNLPQDRSTSAERVAPLSKPRGTPPPKVFSPLEMESLLANVDKEYQPWLALAAFAGLRKAEIVRLTWDENIFWEDRLIYITERVAKRTTRQIGDVRYIPMPDNLVAWLRDHRQTEGFVCPGKTESQREGGIERQQAKLAKLLPGERWGKNPVRHSWESYRAAETSDLQLTTMEAGNSPEVARKAYLNPRLKRVAVLWFAIMPPGMVPEGKLVEFK